MAVNPEAGGLSIHRQLRHIRDDLVDLKYALGRNVRHVTRAADDYVRANPWRAAGATAALAVTVAAVFVLATRRG